MALVELFGEKLVSKEGEVATKDAVAGKKTILVYFSAHWCPPCRGFTPQLAEAYKACGSAGKDVMVIFASSDRDQASFDEYYGSMPWHALPYGARDLKEKLSAKFGVKGIPMLVVLDGEGNMVTSNGRAEYAKYLPAGGTAVAPAADAGGVAGAFVELFGEKLVSKTGEVSTSEALSGKSNVLVYFSAHWCPPCRGFTPQLAQAYKDSTKAGKDTVVVFASGDKDQASFDEYYGEMPWHALPFSQRDLKQKLSTKFDVQGIPMLIVLDGNGKLLSSQGRKEYTTYLPLDSLGGAAAAGKPKGGCCVIS